MRRAPRGWVRRGGGWVYLVHRELMLTPDNRAHLIEPAATAGTIGLAWEWD
ncbi:hypothetical protein GCM10010522_45450 [Kribbella solani]